MYVYIDIYNIIKHFSVNQNLLSYPKKCSRFRSYFVLYKDIHLCLFNINSFGLNLKNTQKKAQNATT